MTVAGLVIDEVERAALEPVDTADVAKAARDADPFDGIKRDERIVAVVALVGGDAIDVIGEPVESCVELRIAPVASAFGTQRGGLCAGEKQARDTRGGHAGGGVVAIFEAVHIAPSTVGDLIASPAGVAQFPVAARHVVAHRPCRPDT